MTAPDTAAPDTVELMMRNGHVYRGPAHWQATLDEDGYWRGSSEIKPGYKATFSLKDAKAKQLSMGIETP